MRSSARKTFVGGVLTTACSFFFLGCDSTPPPTPVANLNPQQMHGYQLFQVHCAECHHDRTDAALHGPGLRGVLKKQYLPSGAPANDDRVNATILNGRGLMPPQRFITEQDRADLIAYLHTL